MESILSSNIIKICSVKGFVEMVDLPGLRHTNTTMIFLDRWLNTLLFMELTAGLLTSNTAKLLSGPYSIKVME